MTQVVFPSDINKSAKTHQPGKTDIHCKAAAAATIAGSWEEGTFCKEQSIRTFPQSVNLLVLRR
jgi:hypothetical protein